MKKIMFICTGNICRSAMAEKMLDKYAKEQGLNMQVYSCGTYAENGDAPTIEAIDVMEDYDVNLKSHRATNIINSKIKEMDIILCATRNHKNFVLQMYPSLDGRVFTMKEYVGEGENDLSDPWGCGIVVYRNCAAEIEIIIKKLIEKIIDNEEELN